MSASPFGGLFCNLDDAEKKSMAARLAFRIPVVQHVLTAAFDTEVSISDYLKPFADSTRARRLPNNCAILDLIRSECSDWDSELRYALENVGR